MNGYYWMKAFKSSHITLTDANKNTATLHSPVAIKQNNYQTLDRNMSSRDLHMLFLNMRLMTLGTRL